MVETIVQQIYALVRPYAGNYIFNIKTIELLPETDLDTDLDIDEFEAEDLMNDFFTKFNVDRGNFRIETYYPAGSFSWNPFRKITPVLVPDFTIGMLIESAKAGRWLYA